MGRVIIMAGVPGSGKSHWVEKFHKKNPGAFVVSTDSYFMSDGEYMFDPAQIGVAHQDTLRKFVALVQSSRSSSRSPTVIVDNTNSSVAEIAPYAALAEAFGHSVEINLILTPPMVAFNRNIHGVPADVILKMHARLMGLALDLPPWWNVTPRSGVDD